MCGCMTTLKSDTSILWPIDPNWSTVHPGSILRDASSSSAEQNVNTKVRLSPRTPTVIEAAASTSGMQIESDKLASSCSLCCVAFSTHHRVPRATDWLRLTSSNSHTDQYLSSSALPERPIHVIRVPIPLAGQVPGHAGLFEACLLRWSSTSSENIPLIHYRWPGEFVGWLYTCN